MANTTLTLDPGEPYSRPATSLPASKVPPQPGVGVAVTAKPARHQGTPTAGRKTLDVARSTGGGQNRMRSPSIGTVQLKHVADVDISLSRLQWIVTSDGQLTELDAGQVPPSGSTRYIPAQRSNVRPAFPSWVSDFAKSVAQQYDSARGVRDAYEAARDAMRVAQAGETVRGIVKAGVARGGADVGAGRLEFPW